MTPETAKKAKVALSLSGGVLALLVALTWGAVDVVKAYSERTAARIRADIKNDVEKEVVAPVAGQAKLIDASSDEMRRLRLRISDLEKEVDDLRRWFRRRASYRGAPHHAPAIPEAAPSPLHERVRDAAARYLPHAPAPRIRRPASHP